jgi:hypothetical protein
VSVVRDIVHVFTSVLVGGAVGYAANRALNVRLGRLEVFLVLVGLAAYWVSETRAGRVRGLQLER